MPELLAIAGLILIGYLVTLIFNWAKFKLVNKKEKQNVDKQGKD